MKLHLFVFLIIISSSLSCKKDEDPYWGTAKAFKNGEKWEARPSGSSTKAYPDGFIGIIADIVDNEGFFY